MSRENESAKHDELYRDNVNFTDIGKNDFWLKDDFYNHDDYYPHLYYDNYYGNESPQPASQPSFGQHLEAAAPGYGLLEYIDRHYEAPQQRGREYEPNSLPISEPSPVRESGFVEYIPQDNALRRFGYDFSSDGHNDRQGVISEQIDLPVASFATASLITDGTALAAEHIHYSGEVLSPSYSEAHPVPPSNPHAEMSERCDLPLISPARPEPVYVSGERSVAHEATSATAVLHQEPQAVLPSYQHIAETGLATSYCEHVIPQEISSAAESATIPDLTVRRGHLAFDPNLRS